MFQCVSVSGCSITPETAIAFSQLTALTNLDASMCDGLNGTVLDVMLSGSGQNLVQLNLSGSRIGRWVEIFLLGIYVDGVSSVS